MIQNDKMPVRRQGVIGNVKSDRICTRGTVESAEFVPGAGPSRGSIEFKIYNSSLGSELRIPIERVEEAMMPFVCSQLQDENIYFESDACREDDRAHRGMRYTMIRVESGVFKGAQLMRYSNL